MGLLSALGRRGRNFNGYRSMATDPFEATRQYWVDQFSRSEPEVSRAIAAATSPEEVDAIIRKGRGASRADDVAQGAVAPRWASYQELAEPLPSVFRDQQEAIELTMRAQAGGALNQRDQARMRELIRWANANDENPQYSELFSVLQGRYRR